MLEIIRDTITTPKGYLNLYFKRDWTPISNKRQNPDSIKNNSGFDHVSFGHDIETAYLLIEASKVLGIKNDTVTLRKAKKMVDGIKNMADYSIEDITSVKRKEYQ